MTNAHAGAARPESHSGAGIAFVAVGVFCVTINDALVKHLGETYPVVQVVFFRMLFALPLIAGMAFAVAGRSALLSRRPVFHLGRGLLNAIAAFSFYLGLTHLPLAETTAIAFSAPLFVTLLAIPLLGERPGAGQWLVTLLGFVGVVLIIQPGGDAFSPAAVLPLITALSYASFMLSARFLQRDENLWTTMSYATVVPLTVSAVALPWVWQMPQAGDLPFFIGSGVFGGLGMTLITQGFRVGTASVVAPFDYTGMVWAVFFGWLFWSEIPSPLAILGGLVIAGCGIFLAWKHGRASRRSTMPETLPPP